MDFEEWTSPAWHISTTRYSPIALLVSVASTTRLGFQANMLYHVPLILLSCHPTKFQSRLWAGILLLISTFDDKPTGEITPTRHLGIDPDFPWRLVRFLNEDDDEG